MRATPARVLAVLALGAAVASTAACIPGVGGADTKAACDNMKSQLEGIPGKVGSLTGNPSAAAQVYTDAASKIRAEGAKAGGDVQTAGGQVASDLESIGNTLREAASGNFKRPDTASLISSGRKLQVACSS